MKFKINKKIEMLQQMCVSCKKNSEEYYELELTLRNKYFNREDFNKIINKFLDKTDKINKIEEIEHGINIFFSDFSKINKVISYFKKSYFCDIKKSKKIVGRNFLESIDKYRYFLNITLINLKKEDIINYKGIKYKVRTVERNKINLLNLEDNSKHLLSYTIIKDYFYKIQFPEETNPPTKDEIFKFTK